MSKTVSTLVDITIEKAASEDKSLPVYMASQSNDLKQMMIRWANEDMQILMGIKSTSSLGVLPSLTAGEFRLLLDRYTKEAEDQGEPPIFYAARQNDKLRRALIALKQKEILEYEKIIPLSNSKVSKRQ